MAEIRWWIALTTMGLTSFVFGAAMFRFFRFHRGDARLRICLLLGIASGLLAVFGVLFQRGTVGAPAFVFGFGLLLISLGIFWSAKAAHGTSRPAAAFSFDPPPHLTTQGPYRVVRHPFYLAYVLGFAGGAALTEALWVWAVPVWMACIYAVAARQEERQILASPLGAAYRDYMIRTGGLVPRLPGFGR